MLGAGLWPTKDSSRFVGAGKSRSEAVAIPDFGIDCKHDLHGEQNNRKDLCWTILPIGPDKIVPANKCSQEARQSGRMHCGCDNKGIQRRKLSCSVGTQLPLHRWSAYLEKLKLCIYVYIHGCVPLGIIGILSDCFALTLILKEQGAGARWGVSGQRRHPPPGCKRTCTCDNTPLFHRCGLFPWRLHDIPLNLP